MPANRLELRAAPLSGGHPIASPRLVLDLHVAFIDLPAGGMAVQAGDVLGLDGLLETIVVAPCDGLVHRMGENGGVILLTPLRSRTAARA